MFIFYVVLCKYIMMSLICKCKGEICFQATCWTQPRVFQDKMTALYIYIQRIYTDGIQSLPKTQSYHYKWPISAAALCHRGFDVLEEWRGEFESRCSDVNEHKEIFNFTENPFHVDPSSLTITQLCPSNRAALESGIVELQTNDLLQVEQSLVSQTDFPTLKPFALKATSFFVSTYTRVSQHSQAWAVSRGNTPWMRHKDCNNEL